MEDGCANVVPSFLWLSHKVLIIGHQKNVAPAALLMGCTVCIANRQVRTRRRLRSHLTEKLSVWLHSITNEESQRQECHIDLWMPKYTLISCSSEIPIFSVPTQMKFLTQMALITCMNAFAAFFYFLFRLPLLPLILKIEISSDCPSCGYWWQLPNEQQT